MRQEHNLVGVAMVLLMSSATYAQRPEAPPTTAAALIAPAVAKSPAATSTVGPAAPEAGDILVTAQRRTESSTRVPLSIAAFNGRQLEQRGIANITELGRVVPGLTFVGLGAWAQPSMRGISTTVTGPGNDNPIAIYVDGVYLGQQVGSAFDLPDVERVEVLKGPQGTLFGRNATGGAIRIFTRAPSFKPTVSITATAGFFTGSGSSRSAADLGIKGYVSGPINDKIAVSFSGHYNHAGGYYQDIVRNKKYGAIEDFGGRLKLLLKPSDTASLTLSAFYNKRNDQAASIANVVDGLAAAAVYPDGVVAHKPWQMANDTKPDVKIKSWGVSLQGDIELGGGTLTSITSYTDTRSRLIIDADGGYSKQCLAASACISFLVPAITEKTFAQEVYYASRKLNRFSFVVGANMYRSVGIQASVVNDFSKGSPFPGLSNGGPIFAFEVRTKTRAYAAFTELSYDLTDRLHAIVGGRFSYEKKIGYGAFSCCDASALPEFVAKDWKNAIGRASLRYDVAKDANVYATFSQGFKSGVVPYDDFSGRVANPENINAFEVGYKHGGHVFPFSIAAFYYDYRNLQVLSFEKIVSFISNAANAKIWGIDFDGTLHATRELDLRLGLSYLPKASFENYKGAIGYNVPLGPFGLTQYVTDLSGHRLFKTPKLTGSFTATYTKNLGGGRLTATSTLYYSSSFTYDVAQIIGDKAYATLSAQLSYKPNDSRLELTLWGKNLTNKAYSVSAIPGGNGAVLRYGAPREVGVSANYSF